jgi:hypothetical protein
MLRAISHGQRLHEKRRPSTERFWRNKLCSVLRALIGFTDVL